MPNSKPNTSGLRPNPHKLGVEPLEEGEVSRVIRVRAKEPVHDWLKELNAKKIGDLLERAYEEVHKSETPP